MKIAVMGFSGAGKSTLARQLAELYSLPLLHLDQVNFLPGWVERSKQDKLALVKDFIDAKESWVIDGNYHSYEFERRAEEADKIILLDFNRFVCLKNAVKRYRRYKGTSRPDMTEGCIEKLDREFVWWILHKGRSKRVKDSYRRLEAEYRDKFVRLKNRRQVQIFVSALAKKDKV